MPPPYTNQPKRCGDCHMPLAGADSRICRKHGWNWDGTLDRIHHALYLKCREKAAREASPTACIIDSQSVKSAEKGGLASTATASMPAS